MSAAPVTAADMGSRSANTEDSPSSGEVPAGGRAPHDHVFVGLVTRPHGVRGEIKVEIWSDVPGRFDPGSELLVTLEGRPAHRVRIASFRPARASAVVRFDGCRTREQAESLRGSRLAVERREVPAAPAGLYYHFDLVGCRCVDADAGELGEVAAVVEDGGGVLLEVRRAGRTLPVPFVEAFLESVDVAAKQIRLRLPPGLVEACESRS